MARDILGDRSTVCLVAKVVVFFPLKSVFGDWMMYLFWFNNDPSECLLKNSTNVKNAEHDEEGKEVFHSFPTSFLLPFEEKRRAKLSNMNKKEKKEEMK